MVGDSDRETRRGLRQRVSHAAVTLCESLQPRCGCLDAANVSPKTKELQLRLTSTSSRRPNNAATSVVRNALPSNFKVMK